MGLLMLLIISARLSSGSRRAGLLPSLQQAALVADRIHDVGTKFATECVGTSSQQLARSQSRRLLWELQKDLLELIRPHREGGRAL